MNKYERKLHGKWSTKKETKYIKVSAIAFFICITAPFWGQFL